MKSDSAEIAYHDNLLLQNLQGNDQSQINLNNDEIENSRFQRIAAANLERTSGYLHHLKEIMTLFVLLCRLPSILVWYLCRFCKLLLKKINSHYLFLTIAPFQCGAKVTKLYLSQKKLQLCIPNTRACRTYCHSLAVPTRNGSYHLKERIWTFFNPTEAKWR